MRQDINLYQDRLVEKKPPLQCSQALLILLVVLVGLAAVAIYSSNRGRKLNEEVVALRTQQQQQLARLEIIRQNHPPKKQNILLQEAVERLEQDIESKKRALNYFADLGTDRNDALLASLEGLARLPSSSVWLRQVNLSQGGDSIQLVGSALDADQVPDYVSRLGERQVFGGRTFAALKLERIEEQEGRIDFVLESGARKGRDK